MTATTQPQTTIPPGYKQTEVGIIPEDWEVKTLGILTTLLTNGFVGTATTAYVEREDGVLYIQGYNVQENGFNFHGIKRVSKAFHARHMKSCLQEGDLLTIQTGEIGVTTVVPSELAGANCHALIISRFRKQESEPIYYCQYFNSQKGHAAFKEIETGTTMKHLNGGDMKRLLLPSPPLPEQRAIAGALSDAEAWIESLEKLIAKKRAIKQGTMQALLTPPGQPGHQRLPGFKGEWEVKRLGEMFDFSGGVSASRDQLSDTGYCYLHYGDIHTRGTTWIDVDAEGSVIPKLRIPLAKVPPTALLADGDVVFVDASEDDEGASKHVVVFNPQGVPYISGLHTIVAKAKTGELDHVYRRYCFQTRNVRSQFRFYAVGTKVTGVSKASIAKIELCFPPTPAEQTAIAAVLSDMDAELEALEAKLSKARQIKQGMMQELLTGRVRLV